jgi:hypothetical protein
MKHLYRLFLCIWLLVEIACQHSSPTDDISKNGNAVKGYNLYVGNWGGNEVFVVYTDSNAVADTLHSFPYTVWHIAVTTSGAKLYVCTRDDVPPDYTGAIFSVDVKTNNVKMIHDKISDVFVSPQGTAFVTSYSYAAGLSQGSIGIIDTLTDVITFFDTLDIRDTGFNYQSVVFDKNRSLFYAVNNSRQLFAYDYNKNEIVRVYQNLFDPLHMVLSLDGKFIYVAGGRVFDLESDAVIARAGGNPRGSLAITPDGEFLYVTDPGSWAIPEPIPSGKVFIFQTSTNRYVGEIDIRNAVPPGYGKITDRIILTPDGKTAYVSGWINLVFVIDVQAKEVVKVIEMSAFTIPMALGIKQ